LFFGYSQNRGFAVKVQSEDRNSFYRGQTKAFSISYKRGISISTHHPYFFFFYSLTFGKRSLGSV